MCPTTVESNRTEPSSAQRCDAHIDRLPVVAGREYALQMQSALLRTMAAVLRAEDGAATDDSVQDELDRVQQELATLPPDARPMLALAARFGWTAQEIDFLWVTVALATDPRLVGKTKWVPFSSAQAVSDPSQLQSDFGKWMLAASTAKPSNTDHMNCWELICFGAYQAGVISEGQLRAIYKRGVENIRNGVFKSFGPTFEQATRGSAPETFVVREEQHPLAGDVDNPIPLRGDIVVFQSALEHACIATGKLVKNADGDNEHQVASLWQPNKGEAERTTIETLARYPTKRPIMFWSARWEGL
jgi:hypothetical protein